MQRTKPKERARQRILDDQEIREGCSARSRRAPWTDRTAYLAQRNAAPKPYSWKAEGAEILAKIKRARAALNHAKAVM